MPVLTNISTLAQCLAQGEQRNIHPIEDAAIAWQGERIAWVGRESELPEEYQSEKQFDAGGGIVTPGLIDCHTHLAFGGWRSEEFAMRCEGVSYLEIAKGGGGILDTVAKTRRASKRELVARSELFLSSMRQLGVTTVEAKSGYGLSRSEELKQLQVYEDLRSTQESRIVSTFLGAHTVPPEFKGKAETYVDYLIEMMPEVTALASFADIFVEKGAFTVPQAERYLAAARDAGLGLKIHADQLSNGGGAGLAARLNAASADHLEFTDDEGMDAMATSGCIAVALPLATTYLRNQHIDASQWIRRGVRVAIATDFNPGSAPSFHLPLAMTLACTQSRMTPEEALKAVTINAAMAIRMEQEIGSLEEGKMADFVVLDSPSINHWIYHFIPNAVRSVFIGGELVAN